MPSKSLDDLTPDTRAAAEQLLSYAKISGINLIVTQTLRTCEYQNELYAQGRTAPGGVVTGTPGCRSWHTHGRALDVLVMDDGKIVGDGTDPRYLQLGEYARTLGFRWGGDFGDPGHFEYHPGLTIGEVCPDPTDCSGLNPTGSVKAESLPVEGLPKLDAAVAAASALGVFLLAKAVLGRPRMLAMSNAEGRRYAQKASLRGTKWPFRSFVYDEMINAYRGVDRTGRAFVQPCDGGAFRWA